MGLNSISYKDRVRYSLQHKSYGSEFIPEPIGWRNDEKEFSRHKDYHGILTKFSNNLKFISDGADYITYIKDAYGINDNIRLIRDERNPNTDIWERSYAGDLDLSTYARKNGEVTIKFNSSGLEQLLKSRESEKVEIERSDSMDGAAITNFVPHETVLKGREIFLKTTFTENNTSDGANVDISSNAGNTRNQTVGYPLKIEGKSHESAQSVTPQTNGDENSGDVGMMFFAVSDVDRVLKIKFKFTCDLFVQQYENVDWAFYKIQLTKFNNDTDYNTDSSTVLYNLGDNHDWFGGDFDTVMPQFTMPVTVDFEQTIIINAGDSLDLEGYVKADFHTDNNAGLRVLMQNFNVEHFSVEENSFFDETTAYTVLSHNLGERLIEIITGQREAFYSEVLGRSDIGYDENGEAAWLGFTHGFWIRGFNRLPLPAPATDTTPEVVNKYKGFTTSFKEFRESISALWNLGVGIEKIGFKERIRIEKKSYFYNPNILITLPNQAQNVKRSIAKEYYFSGIETGFSKGGSYEEAMGLDEYNSKSTFTTVIHRLKKSYKAISKYRGDAYGKEFARRKQKASYPSEDTAYDNHIFTMDLKKGIIYMLERTWEDDFSQAPTGVFSPETATNLRLSPFNIMLRHGWSFSAGFIKYITDYVRYSSSISNSHLTTKLIGGNEHAENGNIINSELDTPKFIPEWIEFEHEVDFNLIKQIEGSTTILGKEIPNFYGKVQFINENGNKETGYLFNLKPNNKGKWKLLKSN